ncbi:hypothetical protein [Streptomyces roseolus]|nr:hypothetical protein [Streptomyces roseolus]
MTDDCAAGHSWEVYSGDSLNCIFCDTTATAVIDEEEDDGPR